MSANACKRRTKKKKQRGQCGGGMPVRGQTQADEASPCGLPSRRECSRRAAFASRRPSAFAAMPRCHASRSASPLPCPPPTPLRRASCRQGCTHCGHAWRFSPGGARDSSRAGSSSRVIWGQDEGDRRGLRSKTRRGTLCVQPEDTATAESSDDAQHHPPDFRRSCSYRRV